MRRFAYRRLPAGGRVTPALLPTFHVADTEAEVIITSYAYIYVVRLRERTSWHTLVNCWRFLSWSETVSQLPLAFLLLELLSRISSFRTGIRLTSWLLLCCDTLTQP